RPGAADGGSAGCLPAGGAAGQAAQGGGPARQPAQVVAQFPLGAATLALLHHKPGDRPPAIDRFFVSTPHAFRGGGNFCVPTVGSGNYLKYTNVCSVCQVKDGGMIRNMRSVSQWFVLGAREAVKQVPPADRPAPDRRA